MDFLLPVGFPDISLLSSTKVFEMLKTIFSAVLIIAFAAPLSWAAEDGVKLVKGDNGWKMVVDGKDFYVKGFTWSHCPVGMKYDYDLFAEKESDIKAALKRDMSLICLLYTSPSPRDATLSRMPSSA